MASPRDESVITRVTPESDDLRALAKGITAVYVAETQPVAAMLIGSAAEGVSDRYSDLDLGMYYDDLPTEQTIGAARAALGVANADLLAPRSESGLIETYLLNGVDCQVIHANINAWQKDMDTVLVEHDAGSVIQKALEGVTHALPLHGEHLILSWQAQAKDYPPELGLEMLRRNIQIRPIWYVADRLSGRDALMFLHQMRIDAIHNILAILAGLNCVYFSTFQFKRLHRFSSALQIAPRRLADRIDEALEADPAGAAGMIEELARETLDLVRVHAPEIDLSSIRHPPGSRQQPW